MEALGYVGDREFNMLHGHRRLFFWDEANQRQVDVFVDEANLCHRIDLRRRIELAPLTLSLADLTVLKLQVVETNEKDYLDICAIFADHDLTADESGVNGAYIAELSAARLGAVADPRDGGRAQPSGSPSSCRSSTPPSSSPSGSRRLRAELDDVPKTRRLEAAGAGRGAASGGTTIPEEVH